MELIQKYIELLENEIGQKIKEEVQNGTITWENEQELHVLFENCKHAKDYMAIIKKNPY